MSSYDGGGFAEWVDDSIMRDINTPRDRLARVTALLEPWREDITWALLRFEPEEHCWRDFRNALWDRIPDHVCNLLAPLLRGDPPPPSQIKVYVAGGGDERYVVVKPLIGALEAAGVRVTHDWTDSQGYETNLPEHESAELAQQDLTLGVVPADLLWYVAPVAKSEGSHGELVVAHALRKTLIVSGPYRAHRRIFPLLAPAENRFDEHAEAFAAILKLARP